MARTREEALDVLTNHIYESVKSSHTAQIRQLVDNLTAESVVGGTANAMGHFNFQKFLENFNKALPIINFVLKLAGVPVTIPPLLREESEDLQPSAI